jgi:hypothetical protein
VVRHRGGTGGPESATSVEEATPRRTWWDTREEPPAGLTDWLTAVSNRLRRPQKSGPESRIGAIVVVVVAATLLLALIWVVFLSVAQQL